MFDTLRELGVLGDYNPYPMFKKYARRGLPFYEVEEAITDGVVDAYMRFNPCCENDFGVFAHLHVLGQITARFKARSRHRLYSGWFGDGSGGDEFASQIPAPEVDADQNTSDIIAGCFAQQLEKIVNVVFPERNAETYDLFKKRNRKREIMTLRYVKGMEWGAIAEKLGMKNKQAAQWHDASGKAAIFGYIRSVNGHKRISEILAEYGDLALMGSVDPLVEIEDLFNTPV